MIALMVSLQSRIGESDCETIGAGWLAQPVNALSSAVFVFAGGWLVARAVRAAAGETATQVVYGLALAGVGIGSIAFHGPAPPGARLLHDLTIAAVFSLIAVRNLGTVRNWGERTVLLAFTVATVAVGVVMALSADLGNAITVAVGLLAVGSEIHLYRIGLRRPASQTIRRQVFVLVALLPAAGFLNLLGRTGGPFCEPDSLLQGHAAWHALTAVAFTVYAYTAFSNRQATTESI